MKIAAPLGLLLSVLLVTVGLQFREGAVHVAGGAVFVLTALFVLFKFRRRQ